MMTTQYVNGRPVFHGKPNRPTYQRSEFERNMAALLGADDVEEQSDGGLIVTKGGRVSFVASGHVSICADDVEA